MEPILEEADSISRRSIVLNPLLSIEPAQAPARDLAFKAGFVSLRERLSNWNKHSSLSSRLSSENKLHETTTKQPATTTTKADPQFANLYEFFQSKSSYKKQLEQEEQMRQLKRPRMPIMKLSKEDWNVKCWEQRVQMRGETHNQAGAPDGTRLARKPELQVDVFNGRVYEVAKKLEKVREGRPLDELLYKLEMNRLRERRREHSWTDQLKQELSDGTHDRKRLKSRLGGDGGAAGPQIGRLQRRQQQQQGASHNDERQASTRGDGPSARPDKGLQVVKASSALGRPIRRLFADDDDHDQE